MPKKILIIEDEEYLVDMYKIKFEQEGFQVLAAYDGLQGIELAKKELPDLILLDLVLPKLDGYQTLKKLRLNKTTHNLKVYILSNLVQSGEINKSLNEGADGYLIKANLTPSQLIAKVKQIFKGIDISENYKASEQVEVREEPEKLGKILLIDDEEALVNMYKLRFIKAGYEVEAAHNGAWGFRLAKEQSFDVIIMDMVMPAVDGYTLIKQLKKDEKTKNIPVIVLTNSAQDKDMKDVIESGASGCFLKSSITPAKLVKEVEKLFIKNESTLPLGRQ